MVANTQDENIHICMRILMNVASMSTELVGIAVCSSLVAFVYMYTIIFENGYLRDVKIIFAILFNICPWVFNLFFDNISKRIDGKIKKLFQ